MKLISKICVVKKSIRAAAFLLGACGIGMTASAQDIVSTAIGGGPNGIPGVNANLFNPYEVAVDATGNVYVAAAGQNRVFEISKATGAVTIIAGTGIAGYSGDGALATAAQLNNPWGVAVDGATPANVYIGDFGNCLVRKVTASTGVIITVAGLVVTPTTGAKYTSCGFSGDHGKANAAQLNGAGGVVINPTNNDLYVADFYEGVVRKIAGGTSTGTITTVAGIGAANCQGTAPFGDAAAATAANLCYPQGVSLDTSVSPANLFISEYDRCAIREVVGSSGDIYRVAGSYTLGCGFTDNVNALSSQLNDPWQSHVSVSGTTTTVVFADYYNARIREFTLTYKSGVPQPGTIKTIGGKGSGGFCNDAGPALNACMNPVGLAYDSSGNYYIGDYGSDRVRKVTKSSGEINTIFGWGPNGGTQALYSNPVGLTGVGGTPSLYYPLGVYADPASNKVYVGGNDGESVYAWDSVKNEITGFAGNGVAGFAGDGSLANSAAVEMNGPIGVATDSKGNVYIADTNNCAIREVGTNGDIATIAGGSSGSLKGCGYTNSTAVNSQFSSIYGIAVDAKNNIYVADYGNCAIRKITASSKTVSTLAGGPTLGCGYSGDGGPAIKAQLRNPSSIALDSAGNVYFMDLSNYRVRVINALSGNIDTVAGDGVYGYNGDGPAIGVQITNGYMTSDPNGNLFISDTDNQILRWVTPTGEMITFAGTLQSAAFSGDGGAAAKAQFYYPAFITRDSSGNTYVADEYNQRVRKITPFAGYGLSAASLNFETQAAGTESSFQAVKVSAVGPTTFGAVTVTAGFSEIDDCAGQSFTSGQTCEIDVYFDPSAAGSVNGTLSIASNAFFAANPSKVALSAAATGLVLHGSLAFGSQPLKSSTSSTLTLTNSGAAIGLSRIYLTSTTVFSITGGTCPLGAGTLAQGASCTVIVKFAPTAVGGQKSTFVVVSNDAASPFLAEATGSGTEIKVSVSSIAFGSISYGTNATSDVTISNTGTAAFTLTPSITGTGFSISSTNKTCGTTLAGGASCVLPVEYNPSAVGSNTGTLVLATNGGSSPSVSLSGTATTDTSVSPATLAFGTITHATTKVANVTVANVGKIASLTVKTAVSGTGAAMFSVLTTGNTCTAGVAPGKTCVLPVQFKPSAAAAYVGTLTVTTNGGTNPTVSLTGTGK